MKLITQPMQAGLHFSNLTDRSTSTSSEAQTGGGSFNDEFMGFFGFFDVKAQAVEKTPCHQQHHVCHGVERKWTSSELLAWMVTGCQSCLVSRVIQRGFGRFLLFHGIFYSPSSVPFPPCLLPRRWTWLLNASRLEWWAECHGGIPKHAC